MREIKGKKFIYVPAKRCINYGHGSPKMAIIFCNKFKYSLVNTTKACKEWVPYK